MELWMPISGFNSVYYVSNIGRIKSIDRYLHKKDGNICFQKGLIMKPVNHPKGYLYVSLSKNNKRKSYKIHRIVAQTFIENVENNPQVNHINGVKNDNSVYNLEWCTREENCIHSFNTGLSKPYWKGKNRRNETKIKISNNQKGRVSNRKGVVLSQETKDKISIKLKGNIPWNKGKKIKK